MQLQRRNNKSMASITNIYADIQEKVYVNDGEGGSEFVWSTVTGYESVPMSIWAMSAQRKAELRSYNVEATHYIKLRVGVNVVESNNRFKYGSRYFDISTKEDIQNRGIEYLITAREYRE